MKPLINFVAVGRADAFGSGVSLYLAVKEYGHTNLVDIIGLIPAPDDGSVIPPTAHLDGEGAQRLMDQLYGLGVRPTEAAGSAGAMAAVQAHLKDLQRLVFKGKP